MNQGIFPSAQQPFNPYQQNVFGQQNVYGQQNPFGLPSSVLGQQSTLPYSNAFGFNNQNLLAAQLGFQNQVQGSQQFNPYNLQPTTYNQQQVTLLAQQGKGPVGDTGPAALFAIAAGAAGGVGYVRRKKRY